MAVLLVDARPWRREALALALETAFRVLRFGDVSELAQADPQTSEVVVVLNINDDIRLADNRVSTAVATAHSCLPGLPVVVLSESADVEDILCAIERGLRGYIPMSLELGLVIRALQFVAVGGTFVPAECVLANPVAPTPLGSPPEPSVGEAAATPRLGDAAVLNTLTPREVAVLDWLGQGKSNKQIARQLDMSEATVKVHVRHIMRKLGAVNRTQVALFADILVKK